MVQSVGRTGVAEYITDVGDGRIAPVPADGGVARAFLERLPEPRGQGADRSPQR